MDKIDELTLKLSDERVERAEMDLKLYREMKERIVKLSESFISLSEEYNMFFKEIFERLDKLEAL